MMFDGHQETDFQHRQSLHLRNFTIGVKEPIRKFYEFVDTYLFVIFIKLRYELKEHKLHSSDWKIVFEELPQRFDHSLITRQLMNVIVPFGDVLVSKLEIFWIVNSTQKRQLEFFVYFIRQWRILCHVIFDFLQVNVRKILWNCTEEICLPELLAAATNLWTPEDISRRSDYQEWERFVDAKILTSLSSQGVQWRQSAMRLRVRKLEIELIVPHQRDCRSEFACFSKCRRDRTRRWWKSIGSSLRLEDVRVKLWP